MQLVAVTRVLNEEDIIEAMVRHHAALVDHHILLDNGSEDRTLEILAALHGEGLPITVLQHDTVIFSETQFNTHLYKRAVELHKADWVLCLDADEFVDTRRSGDLRRYLAAVPARHRSLGLELVNYDAATAASESEVNPARKFCRRRRKPTGVWKVFVRGGADAGRVTVDAGNHHIALDGLPAEPLQQHDIVLAHYPNRSPLHWAGKAVTGRLRVLAAGRPELAQQRAFHYTETVEALKRDPQGWVRGASAGFAQMQTTESLIDDPIDYLGPPLLYTQPIDHGWRTAQLMLSTIEKIATAFGEVLDACPAARGYIDERMRSVRVLWGPEQDAAGRVAYASVVGKAWRSAADPDFPELLGAGWSKPEPWGGVWGVGGAHELRIGFPAPPYGDTEIEAEVFTPLLGARERQSVGVCVGGERLTTWEFTRETNRALRRVRLPAALIARARPLLTLQFRPHSVAAVCDIDPGNRDDRELGMGIRGLRQLPAA